MKDTGRSYNAPYPAGSEAAIRAVTRDRKTSTSFRDSQLLQIFQFGLDLLKEAAKSLQPLQAAAAQSGQTFQIDETKVYYALYILFTVSIILWSRYLKMHI